MPRRKVPTKLSGLVGSDDEDIMQFTENEAGPSQETRDEPPAKRRRGRPRTSKEITATTEPISQGKRQESETASAQPAESKPTSRRGRPRGTGRTSESTESRARAAVTEEPVEDDTYEQENADLLQPTKMPRASKATNVTAPRRRGRVASTSKQPQTDGEFEYTPTSARQISSQEQPERSTEESPHSRAVERRRNEPKQLHEEEDDAADVVDESILPHDQLSSQHAPSSAMRNARASLSAIRKPQDFSPRKRKSGIDPDQGGDPELRRRIGDLTKKQDVLESKYRNLREIGIVEANTNMEKLRKQCESITTGMFVLFYGWFTELQLIICFLKPQMS